MTIVCMGLLKNCQVNGAKIEFVSAMKTEGKRHGKIKCEIGTTKPESLRMSLYKAALSTAYS